MGLFAGILAYLPTVLIILLTTALLVKYIKQLKNGKQQPPKPWWTFPLVGHLPLLGKYPFKTFINMGKRYGDIFMVKLGIWNVLILNNRNLIHEAFVKHFETFAGRPPFFFFELPAGRINIALGEYTSGWKLQRKVANSVLQMYVNGKENHVEELIQNEALNLSFELIKNSENDSINPHKLIEHRVGSIIFQLCYGKLEGDQQNDNFNCLMHSTRTFSDFFAAGNLLDTLPWIRFLIPGTVKQFKSNVKQAVTLREKMVSDRLKTFDGETHRDLTDELIAAVSNLKQNRCVLDETENQLYASLDAIVGAGLDTTATMIEWTVLFMALFPDIQCKIQKEIGTKIGDRKPTYPDRLKLPYTFATMQEVMRIASLIPMGLPHYTTEDVTLRGYFIPQGTVVFSNLYAVSRDAKIFENPEEFHPERFLMENGDIDEEKVEFNLPFGAGRRRCLGEFLAKAAVFVVFTTLLQQCKIEKIPGFKYNLEGELGLTRKPCDFRVNIQHRSV